MPGPKTFSNFLISISLMTLILKVLHNFFFFDFFINVIILFYRHTKETVAAELNKTNLIIQQINTFFERTNFSLSPDLEDDTKIDSKLIEE